MNSTKLTIVVLDGDRGLISVVVNLHQIVGDTDVELLRSLDDCVVDDRDRTALGELASFEFERLLGDDSEIAIGRRRGVAIRCFAVGCHS